MTSETLRKKVLNEVAAQRRARAEHGAIKSPTQMLGNFIEACLTNQKYSHRKFARLLDIDEELAEGILGGVLPESEMDDELLADIARIIRHEPNTLRIILGRPAIPTRDSGANKSSNGATR
jgi:hypothetical protein